MTYNVNRNVMDSFYRYKMPKLVSKVEGKGNGIKTVISNMVDVARALARPPTYPCKYFGCELGAQTQFDHKNERYIVNGSHDSNKLQSLLDGFIKRFVLCPQCENPETVLSPNEKKGIIKQSCKACGYQGLVDMTHRLTTFILKNPPDVKVNQQGSSLTKKKDRKKGENGLRPGSPKTGGSDCSDNDQNGDADDDDWSVDVSDAAVKERQKDLTSGVKNLTISNDAEKSSSERLEVFFDYCKSKKEAGILKPGADLTAYKDIAGEAERLDVKENKGVMVIVELLLDDNILREIPQYRILLLLFTHGNPKVQKYLLGAIEKLIEIKKETLISKTPVILKALYDNDIVEEEVLIEWGKKVSKKYVDKDVAADIHAKAQPFLKWLAEAEEEESSEEEDDEDDLEIDYDDKAPSKSLKEQEASTNDSEPKLTVAEAPTINVSGEEDQSDDDDVDIDNL